ncbi:hypothetical protein GGX14DRAFT_325807, partial [Mycena pura]
LRSNAMPAELESFRKIIDDAPDELFRYASEISNLQTALNRLVREHATLTAYVDGCRSLFSPIRRLPPELLVAVFEMC